MLDNLTPIFILGAAHSGTTILYKMLAMHSDVCWFSQYSHRNGNIPGRFSFPFCQQVGKTLRFMFPHSWQKKEYGIRKLLIPHPSEANQIWSYIIPENEHLFLDESVHRMHHLFEEECRLWRKSHIITKLPRLYKHLPLLQKSYQNSKLIHIIRDGYAVAMSDRHKFMRHGESNMEALYLSASYWKDVVETIKTHSLSDVFEVKYESFCTDVHGYIKNILGYINLRHETFPFLKLPSELESTNHRWLKKISDQEATIIKNVQCELLRYYDYLHE